MFLHRWFCWANDLSKDLKNRYKQKNLCKPLSATLQSTNILNKTRVALCYLLNRSFIANTFSLVTLKNKTKKSCQTDDSRRVTCKTAIWILAFLLIPSTILKTSHFQWFKPSRTYKLQIRVSDMPVVRKLLDNFTKKLCNCPIKFEKKNQDEDQNQNCNFSCQIFVELQVNPYQIAQNFWSYY